jgi:hypothetical protein
MAKAYGEDWETSPTITVIDEALARDPQAAIAMVRESDNWMRSLLTRYAIIDAPAALAASKIELAGTPAKLEARSFFIFDLRKNYPDQFTPAELADALPERRNRIGNTNDLATSGARNDYEGTMAWIGSMENSILRNHAIWAIAANNVGDHAIELLPRLNSARSRNSAMHGWGRTRAQQEGTAAIHLALAQEDPHYRHAALSGVISQLCLRESADLANEIVRMTSGDEIPVQIWDLVYKYREFSPAAILAEDPVKRPHWLNELDPPIRQAIGTQARQRLDQ